MSLPVDERLIPRPWSSVKDALADAEQLRVMTRSIHRGFAYRNTDVAMAASCALFHIKAALEPPDSHGIRYEGDFWIRAAAEHAFKACPELRA